MRTPGTSRAAKATPTSTEWRHSPPCHRSTSAWSASGSIDPNAVLSSAGRCSSRGSCTSPTCSRIRSTRGPSFRRSRASGGGGVARNGVRPFTGAEITLVETFADYVVIAMENVRLFQTVERQRTELARFAPQAADLLSSDEGEQLLAGHRREITTLFCDLRGFTAFAETAEPEEVLRVLREYHTATGELVAAN